MRSDREVVLVCPTAWDAEQLPRVLRKPGFPFVVRLYGPDVEHHPHRFDADAFIAEAVQSLRASGMAGVVSSSDYPGCLVAAVIAQELGLPGPTLDSMLRCSHKYYSRLAQSVAVPEATPRFALIDPDSLEEDVIPLRFPLFVKPVKSWFSQFARRVDSFEELSRFIHSPAVRAHLTHFVRPFNQLLDRSEFSYSGAYMLAEELLTGHQVTLEGFLLDGRLTVVGIVDSQMYPNATSFERFDYPSTVERVVADRMTALARRLIAHIGLTNGLFNIEFIYDQMVDTIHIIEINPRMCGQFADLMESVNGTNTYEIMLALASGEPPPPVSRAGSHAAATSFVLRHFNDAMVRRTPTWQEIALVESSSDVTLIAVFYVEGQRLSEDSYQYDGFSYRYAVVNMAGASRDLLTRRFESMRAALHFRFDEAALI